mgnify:CR=1 FL=1
MDGYLVQQPFADQIASGDKDWDVRIRPIQLPRKPFYILATRVPHSMVAKYDPERLGVAVAIAETRGIVGPLSLEEMNRHGDHHRIPTDILRFYAQDRPLYAMVLKANPIDPRRYRSKMGAVHLIVQVQFE